MCLAIWRILKIKTTSLCKSLTWRAFTINVFIIVLNIDSVVVLQGKNCYHRMVYNQTPRNNKIVSMLLQMEVILVAIAIAVVVVVAFRSLLLAVLVLSLLCLYFFFIFCLLCAISTYYGYNISTIFMVIFMCVICAVENAKFNRVPTSFVEEMTGEAFS